MIYMIGHYLMFNRNCAEALAVYAEAFDGKITEMQKYGDMPPNPAFPVPEADKSLVLHARLVIDGTELMCADSSQHSTAGDNMYVSVTSGAAAVQKAWDALKVGGEVYMELAPAFFSPLHGSLRDRFGVSWMFTARA
jgi:PhnB protein